MTDPRMPSLNDERGGMAVIAYLFLAFLAFIVFLAGFCIGYTH